MSDGHADPELPVDPVDTIFNSFHAGVRGECSWEETIEIAASTSLARDASAESVARLSEKFTQYATQLGATAYRLAELVETHADVLIEMERGTEALQLYEAIRSVIEQYAQPQLLGFYQANRAHLLSTCGRLSEAVSAYNVALPLLREHDSSGAYARCHVYRANLLRTLGNLDEALTSYDASLPILRKHGPADQYALCQMNQVLTLLDLGKVDEAAVGDNVVSLLREHTQPGIYASYLVLRANALAARDKLDEAVVGYGDALPILRVYSSPVDFMWCLIDRSRALVKQRKFFEALADYDSAMPFLRQHADSEDQARCLMERAHALQELERLAEALAGYDDALALLFLHGMPADHASCLRDRAGVLEQQGELVEAVMGYTNALAIFRQAGEVVSFAFCLMNRAKVFERQGRMTAALSDYDEGLPLLREHGMSLAYGWHGYDRVDVLEKLGRLAEAEAAHDEMLAHEKHDDPVSLASALVRRAATLLKQDHLAEAVARFNSAIPLLEVEARSAPTPTELGSLFPKRSPQLRYADCLSNRATALRGLGLLAEAVASYDAALPFYEQEAERTEEAASDDSRALQKEGPMADLAQSQMSRASALGDLGKPEEALAGYDAALPFLRKLDRLEAEEIESEEEEVVRTFLHKHARTASAYCQVNRGVTLVSLGQPAEALAAFDEALPLLQRKQDLHGYAVCLGGRATALQQGGQLVEALAGYDESLRLLGEHGLPTERANCLMNRASMLRLQGKQAEALADYDRVLTVLQEHAAPTEYAQGLFNRACTLVDLGQIAEAVLGFREARAVLLSARRLGRVDDSSVEFTQRWGQLFDASVWTGLAADDADQAYQAVCDGKAGLIGDLRHRLHIGDTAEPAVVRVARAALTDWMRNHVPEPQRESNLPESASKQSLQDLEQFAAERDRRTRSYLSAWGRHHHAYDARRIASPAQEPANRNRIQQCLPMDWALLDFWRTGDEEFTAFVLFRDTSHVVKLPFPIGQLRPRLERMIASLYNPLQDGTNLEVLGDLHHHLFGPLLPLLRSRGIGGMYLVPHDFLHQVPLHAAHSNEDENYLCDEFALAFLPSAAMLPQLPKPDPTGSAFVLANPDFGTDYSLPFAHWEGLQMARMLGLTEGQFYLGTNGTLAATEAWAGAGIVHFSCHGSGDPEFAPRSHLRLSDDLLLAHDVIYRRSQLKEGAVVILNGCQTSVRDTRAVNEGLGLMTAFLVRGAGLVLATQWSVDDACAAEMVLQFVEQLRIKGASPAQALKRAQRHVRQLTVSDIIQRNAEVEEALPAGSRDLAKMKVHRARTYIRAGLLEEAERATEDAIPVLLRSDMSALAERLLRDIHRAQEHGGLLSETRPYKDPVFWGAFQLVGRVT